MNPTNETSIERQAVATPDLALFKSTLEEIAGDAASIIGRRRVAEETRFCLWDGQAPDGRKHKRYNSNREVFPFEGGSDHRVRLADTIINENVRMLMGSLRGAELTFGATEIDDAEQAGRTKLVFNHLRRQNKREQEDAFRLFCNWREGDGPGVAVMGVFWERTMATEPREVSLEDLLGMFFAVGETAEPTAEQVQRAQDLFLNPNLEEEAVELIAEFFGIRKPEARKALPPLRAGELAEIEVPYVNKNGLSLKALRLWEDVFFSANVCDIQRAPCVFLKELFTESELKTQAQARGWPKKFVDEVMKHKGKAWLNFDQWSDTRYRATPTDLNHRQMIDENKDKFEIITAYTKAYNPSSKHGLSSVYRTVFHGGVAEEDAVAEHGPNGYWHGQYPFVVGTQERVSKNVLDSRGVGEIVLTNQLVQKTEIDSTIDGGVLSKIPPIKIRTRKKDMQLKWGPLVQHYLDKGEDYEFANGPKADPRTPEIFARDEKMVDIYFGRKTQNVDPAYAMEVRQDRVDRFLTEAESIYRMGLMLAQQYMSQEEAERIAPGFKQPFNAGGAEGVRNAYDVYLTFDVKSVDPEFVEKKLKAFNEFLVPLDKYGALDGNRMLQDAAKLIDPIMADRFVKSPQSASGQEVEETMDALTKILVGIQPAMPERGINPELRAQTLMQAVQTNPQIQNELRAKPLSLQLFQEYMAYLQQMNVQEQNKVTGRKGTSLSLGGTGNMPTAGFAG